MSLTDRSAADNHNKSLQPKIGFTYQQEARRNQDSLSDGRTKVQLLKIKPDIPIHLVAYYQMFASFGLSWILLLGVNFTIIIGTSEATGEATSISLYASSPEFRFNKSGINVQQEVRPSSTSIGLSDFSFETPFPVALTHSLNENALTHGSGSVGVGFVEKNVVESLTAENRNEAFQIVNEWKYLDFDYPTYTQRQEAISNRDFIPENNLPLGIDVYGDRLFITTPRWKDGVPVSLSYLPYPPKERSPALRPYPDWGSHSNIQELDCSKLISVYRSSIDSCGRLWVIDSGIVNATANLNQICQPKIVAFDLATDKRVVSFTLPPDQVKQDSLHSNILADVLTDQCENAYVYVTDVWRFGMVVYSLAENRSWRVTNYNFIPNPIASDFNVYGLNFQWLDGVFGMSLSLDEEVKRPTAERILYFHPMASFKEFSISTKLLQNESLWPARAQEIAKYFVEIGDRGNLGQSSSAGIARNGIMFYTQVHRDNVACWNTAKPYVRANLAMLLSRGQNLVQFPNDLKVDKERDQGLWVMSNKLPIYLYGMLDYSEVNFRIVRASVSDAIHNSVCDPRVQDAHFNIPVMVQLHEGQCY
ncbi:protein yellow isoform X2 [Ceratitis capitata]|uniref:protein yellow isoform X2 n=1 Tax=Ceratitis capitata TaxID=7213 RepID=UPI000A0FE880|nr:protein yellow isoform X2 [Ceratitis capitata]